MNDDIVTRLSKLADCYKDGDRELLYADYETICDAWREIEYLRNELAEANSEYQKLWNKHNAVMRDQKYHLTNDYIGNI